jgi:DNA-binding response OmpR family regulator
MLVLTSDRGLAELLRTQVENLGCPCSVRDGYEDASSTIDWADAAIVDLVDDGLDHLNRLRVEAPRMRILAVAPDAALGEAAQSAGADVTLVEPFSIADVVEAVRSLGPSAPAVIDLRAVAPVAAGDEEPWWAS